MSRRKITDKQLVRIASEFRKGMLGDNPSTLWCFMICAPLGGMLRAIYGVDAELVEGDLGEINHVWLRLADGRVLDPTADQFNEARATPLPPVYLGPALDIHPATESADA
ncbi:hypothetical protein ACLBYG_22155 [Methylobacterium sp. D53M]